MCNDGYNSGQMHGPHIRDLGRGILRAWHGFLACRSFSGRHSGLALWLGTWHILHGTCTHIPVLCTYVHARTYQ